MYLVDPRISSDPHGGCGIPKYLGIFRPLRLGSRLPFQREVSPISMDSESFDFSEDLSVSSPLSGDRPVCVHPQFSTYQVLCPLQGSSCLEGGRALLPVVSSSTVRLPTVLEKVAQEGADMVLVAPFWPQRP